MKRNTLQGYNPGTRGFAGRAAREALPTRIRLIRRGLTAEEEPLGGRATEAP